MAKGKRVHDEVDTGTYEEDDFVENDDGSAPKKKTKKAAPTKAGKKSSVEEKSWELSSGRNPKRLGVSEFKGQTLIRIGETYEKDGEYLPGKKGISLTVDQYKALLEFIPKMNAHLESQGIKVSGSVIDDDEEMEEKEEAKPQRKAKTKAKSKSNIEATSDEEEDEDE